MKHSVEDLYRVQEDCMDIVKIAVDRMNRRPQKTSSTLKNIYQNQFININETTLKGVYNDRQRNFRSKSRSKTAC